MGSTPVKPAVAGRARRSALWVLGPVVVLSALGVRQYLRSSSRAGAETNISRSLGTTANAGSGTAAPRPTTRRDRPAIDWPVAVRRDPFRSDVVFPPAPKQPPRTDPQRPDAAQLLNEARSKLRFTAVVLGDAPKAMVNGRLYRVGSVVEGYRVVAIDGRQLTLDKDGTRLQLSCE